MSSEDELDARYNPDTRSLLEDGTTMPKYGETFVALHLNDLARKVESPDAVRIIKFPEGLIGFDGSHPGFGFFAT